jgi:hypothetical protein
MKTKPLFAIALDAFWGVRACGCRIRKRSETAVSPLRMFFCDADSKLVGFDNQINAMLADSRLPAVQRRLLMDTQNAMDQELLPAVDKLSQLVRDKTGICPPPS